MDQAFIERLVKYAGAGMVSAFWAQVKPDSVAVWDRFGTRTYPANSHREEAYTVQVIAVLHTVGIDPSLIAGAVASVGSEIFDASVTGLMSALQQAVAAA
jgi:hypothetical protein